ncbi:ubiquitin carboxyl-terminal hydrolase 40 isoform X2 [Tenrec ecaudatus]|uniref:ubiquitin carboxyl-terminal hydrolase 40 isoform X2 n=1 Tax=Tenrec ecaudatus TaxID=94439 RepID=UPI003F59B855
MFGDLFEEESHSVSNNQSERGKKLKTKALDPPAPRKLTKLSGIRNQGGTCYLNSLLQTLHFTPEFREALFSLGPEELGSLEDKDKPDAKVRVIPLQLQRLFAQLLLLDQEAASTADLTDSFGWTSNEEMRQHDVQELNRILFSALESSLVGTSGHDLIHRLYHGTVVNQIVCKDCGNTSEKQEDFLDLTVTVKNTSGLEDALWNMYVEEEVFDYDNLYRCGACDRLVEAVKSAKLRKLPPFLTVSLLRFNFDSVKCERYKETSCYTFPLRINLKPFCEQSESDDSEYTYDLFSIIIHKGGCYGGHYHVYIKDVDHLGNWQPQEEETTPAVNVNDLNGEEMDDDPVRMLHAILSQEERNLIAVDQLGQRLLNKVGLSWNKKYRKQYGPLRKFLQLHSQIFLLSADESAVSLSKSCSLQPKSGPQRKEGCVVKTLASHPLGVHDGTSSPRWFDINDSKVQPIKEEDIEQQFQGKESAYMLFYRKSQLQRPPEARANPRYGLPCHLLSEMDAANTALQAERAECESRNSACELHLHLGPSYHFSKGALHPVASHTKSVWDLTFDKRKTLGDLLKSVFQLFGFWEGDMVLSIAKLLPAGLHVYQALDGDELTLSDLEVADEEDIFVWNGVEVGGVQIQTGADCEPLLLTVLHLAAGREGAQRQHVFPANAPVAALFSALAIPAGAVFVSRAGSSGEESWTALPTEDLETTFREQGLRDGSSVLIQDAAGNGYSVSARPERWHPQMEETNWLQVKNMCGGPSAEQQVLIAAAADTVVVDIRIKAIQELKLMEELAEHTCLRPTERGGRLLAPVPDSYTVKEADLQLGSSLGLCPGKAPSPTQLFLLFSVGSGVQRGVEMEITVEETLTVRECLKRMLEQSGLSGDTWHLRKMDWCYETGEALCEEDATLKELTVKSGDALVLMEGALPPPGVLKIAIWWRQPRPSAYRLQSQQHHVSAATWTAASTQGVPDPLHADVPLLHLGDVDISEEAALVDLKAQAMALPACCELAVPTPACLRAWTMESRRLGRLLRSGQQQLRDCRLGRRPQICLEPLQQEEHLGPQDLVLRTQMRLPGQRTYGPPVDVVWDTTRGCTAASLRQRVADVFALPVEKVEIAKHFPEKFEWTPISSWNQQVAKRKKKKKQDSLQGAPIYLRDGDTVGVKNLLVDEDEDFSTLRDDLGKEQQREAALRRRKSREALRAQSSDVLASMETPARPWGPETPLSIRVDSFR